MKELQEEQLKKLLKEAPEIQLAITTTKVYGIEDDLKELYLQNIAEHKEIKEKIEHLNIWRIRVTAIAGAIGAVSSLILSIVLKLVR